MCHENTSFHGSRNWEASSFPNSALNDYSTIATGTLHYTQLTRESIIINQLGRRNLTPQEASYYRGKLYESRKKQGTRTDLTSAQNVPKLTTAEELGKEYGVSHMTIKRDAEFSQAVDKIAEEIGKEAKDAILTGKANVPKKDVERV